MLVESRISIVSYHVYYFPGQLFGIYIVQLKCCPLKSVWPLVSE